MATRFEFDLDAAGGAEGEERWDVVGDAGPAAALGRRLCEGEGHEGDDAAVAVIREEVEAPPQALHAEARPPPVSPRDTSAVDGDGTVHGR